MEVSSVVPASPQSSARERLSWAAICARYPDEWVVLVHVKHVDVGEDEETGEVESAVVLSHSKTSVDCIREADPILEREGIRESAHLFTGPPVPRGFVSFRLLGL
jgi:hypothetical protein